MLLAQTFWSGDKISISIIDYFRSIDCLYLINKILKTETENSLRKTNFFSQNPQIIFYYIFACVRAEEEKLKLMLQLDEVQLRLKSAEFRKPVTKRIQHKSHDTS